MYKNITKIRTLILFVIILFLNLIVVSGCKYKYDSIKLSIIVPIYNVENYIPICLESLINQTYKNIEIICVNDGSKDNSIEVLNQYKENDRRITIIDKQNGGVSSARNAGINAATGDYITFVDSDDYIDIDAYENCISIIAKQNADIFAFGYTLEPNHTAVSPVSEKIYDKFDCLKNEFSSNCTVWNKIFKRSLLTDGDIRFAEDVSYGEDDLFLKMVVPNAKVIVGCSNPYYHYVHRETSAESTYSIEKRLISAINRCKHLVNYYVDKNYKDEYEWILESCLYITYPRIEELKDDNKKKDYSMQTLNILDDKLLTQIDDISSNSSEMINKLRLYADI